MRAGIFDLAFELPEFKLIVEARVYHDPGDYTRQNGDPGDPPSTTVDSVTLYAKDDAGTAVLEDTVTEVLVRELHIDEEILERANGEVLS